MSKQVKERAVMRVGEPGPVGRATEPVVRHRDYRGNLLLDDREEAVFKRVLRELGKHEGRHISGAEMLRRLTLPFLREAAAKYGLKLNQPKPADVLPINLDDIDD